MYKLIQKIESIRFFLKPKKIVAQYKLHLGDEWLETSVASIAPYVHKILLVVSDVPWGDERIQGNPCRQLDETIQKLQNNYPALIEVLRGSWTVQRNHVQAGLNYIKNHMPEVTHCVYIDGDEIYEHIQFKKLISLTRKLRMFNREIRGKMHTYFKSPEFQIHPPEPFHPMVLFPVRKFTEYTGIRSVNFGFVEADIWLHHMSYVRKTDLEIRNKMITHKQDEGTDTQWYEEVYLNWTPDTKDFHPKDPKLFHSVKVLNKEEILPQILETYESWSK